ncbi:MAG: polysaccharide biosynthesis C-terminal domain-containing protein, partial [Clostridia bacterium]|nr:polysaccharide biosynthesis C-terminal domain-containing protein [Clostridia bacterium]
MTSHSNARTPDLGRGHIPSLMLRLALPSVIAQTINMLYNMVDRMYIGRIEGVGAYALTGVGLTFPVITLISAFSSLFGTGGAPLASIKLGEGNQERASRILGVSAFMLLCTSAVLFAAFQLLMEPLLMAFGASENTLPYASDYLRTYLFGTCFVQLTLGLNPYISAQGRATTAMCSIIIGAALNIALDPLFIFVFGMGVRGAALATVLSQAASCVWVVCALASKQSSIRLERR